MAAIRHWYFHMNICTQHKSLLITNCDFRIVGGSYVNKQSFVMPYVGSKFEKSMGKRKPKLVHCHTLTLRLFR